RVVHLGDHDDGREHFPLPQHEKVAQPVRCGKGVDAHRSLCACTRGEQVGRELACGVLVLVGDGGVEGYAADVDFACKRRVELLSACAAHEDLAAAVAAHED